jgi:DNA-binding transcriptional MerR regulator
MVELLSIRDVGRRLGIAPHQIAYAHTQERLPEPQFRVAGHRIYTPADIEKVATYFAEKRRKKAGGDGDGR